MRKRKKLKKKLQFEIYLLTNFNDFNEVKSWQHYQLCRHSGCGGVGQWEIGGGLNTLTITTLTRPSNLQHMK